MKQQTEDDIIAIIDGDEEEREEKLSIKACSQACIDNKVSCHFNKCEYWIDFREDNNCDLVSIDKHGQLTFRQIGERLGVSFVRIKQIEKAALEKIRSKRTLHVLGD